MKSISLLLDFILTENGNLDLFQTLTKSFHGFIYIYFSMPMLSCARCANK